MVKGKRHDKPISRDILFYKEGRMKKLFCIILAVLVCSTSSFAVGALYARRALSNDAGVPLWLENYDVSVKITDQIAVTHVDQMFKNETSQRLEGIFVFPLPENAVITELALWINGVRVVAKVMDSDTAKMKYDSIVRRSIDPALLQDMGNNVFKLSVFPIDPVGYPMCERRIEITYAELLPYDAASVQYMFFMKTINISPKPVTRASLALDLTAQNKILTLTSPSHSASSELSITKLSDNHYTAVFGNENAYSEKDLRLLYTLQLTQFAMNHLTYTVRPDSMLFFDTTGDNPYFLLWVTPPDTAKPLNKNVVLVADVSSSMTGTRIVQLRDALNAMVDKLNPGDYFNIIAFSTSVRQFSPDIVIAEAASKASAHTFINALSEAGLTDIEDALKAALKSTWDTKKVNAVVFLTDGKPTWPTTSTSATILDTVKARNTGKVEIFTFGIGDGVETDFLKLLAKQNDGFATMILADDSINVMMQSFMSKISFPLLKNLAVNYSGISAYDIYPSPLPNLYAGAQLTVLGRYRTSGEFPITVTGSRGQDTLTLQQTLAFPAAQSDPFVPRMWASAKIDFLLNEIAIYGELSELVNGVKALGKKYSIITKYTSAVVLEPTDAKNMLDKTAGLSKTVKLFQNLPNPFTASTQLRYCVPVQKSPQLMSIKIYDASGKLVKTLVDEVTAGGNYVVHWNATDDHGRKLSAGIYFAVLQVGQVRQMVTMRYMR
jgi:Ca-activated chloride channel family protein